MPDISLTDFIDFVASTGTPRLTKVRNAKCRDPYDPRFDYWKQLREALVAYHEPNNILGKEPFFRNFLNGLNPDSNKMQPYSDVIDNYKRFLGRKAITKLPIQRTTWTHNGLTVRVNPEVFLNINGSRELFKLYFKQDALSKQKADTILTLMSVALPASANVGQFAVYDARNNRTIRSPDPNPDLMILVRAEADAFVSIWNEIGC